MAPKKITAPTAELQQRKTENPCILRKLNLAELLDSPSNDHNVQIATKKLAPTKLSHKVNNGCDNCNIHTIRTVIHTDRNQTNPNAVTQEDSVRDSSIYYALAELQQQKANKPFLLPRLNFALLRDTPPKQASVKQERNNPEVSKKGSAAKFIKQPLKPINLLFSVAQLDDTVITSQSTAKIEKRQIRTTTRVTSYGINRKSSLLPPKTNGIVKKSTRNVRKELFSGNQNKAFKATTRRSSICRGKSKLLNLENISALMDISEMETELFRKPLTKKQLAMSNGAAIKNKQPKSTAIPQKTQNTRDYFKPDFKFDCNTHTNSMSPTETEFLENEKKFNINNKHEPSFQVSNMNSNKWKKEIQTILTQEKENYEELQKTFEQHKQIYEKLQNDISKFEKQYMENREKIAKLLESTSSPINKKTNAVFNVNTPRQTSEECSFSDEKFEKAMNCYNSLRKDFKSILSTPKLNRSCLQTPKSLRKRSKEVISTKVQKQLLMLQDTPVVKK